MPAELSPNCTRLKFVEYPLAAPRLVVYKISTRRDCGGAFWEDGSSSVLCTGGGVAPPECSAGQRVTTKAISDSLLGGITLPLRAGLAQPRGRGSARKGRVIPPASP